MKQLQIVWKWRRGLSVPRGEARINLLAALACLVAVGVLGLSFQSRPADAGLNAGSKGPRLSGISASAVPVQRGPAGEMSAEELRKQIQGAVQTSRLALELHVAMLELGKRRIEAVPDYQATFFKQERLDGGTLLELETMEMKLRHNPLSIYIKWINGGDVGRELLFVEGQNDNRMLVKLGGGKKLLPAVKVDPAGTLAMSEARHPVTTAGVLQLCDQILPFRRRDLQATSGVRWQLIPDQKFDGRPCHCFVVEYDSPEVEPLYRKSLTLVDTELSLPVCVKTFGWPIEGSPCEDPEQLDQATLLEYYGYTDLKLDRRLSDSDFDKGNTEYRFRR